MEKETETLFTQKNNNENSVQDKNHKKLSRLMKRTVKDSVFTNLFRDKKYLIQLYRALHPEDRTATEDDILNVTIRNVLTDNQYNDLGICR